MVASGSLLFVFSSFFFVEVLLVHLLPIDWISFIFLVWNFGAMGVVSIHWKGPLRLQQIYLILCSALSANVFVKYLPNWTTWLLLFAISIYGKSCTAIISLFIIVVRSGGCVEP
jgi:presenilin 1